MKAKYVAPTLRAHGTLEALTHNTRQGRRLDRTEQAGTSLDDLLTS